MILFLEENKEFRCYVSVVHIYLPHLVWFHVDSCCYHCIYNYLLSCRQISSLFEDVGIGRMFALVNIKMIYKFFPPGVSQNKEVNMILSDFDELYCLIGLYHDLLAFRNDVLVQMLALHEY